MGGATGVDNFDAAMALADKGDATNVDLLVGDIYGGDYDEYGLSSGVWGVGKTGYLFGDKPVSPPDTVAASLGKLVRPRERAHARPEDMARGILDAITNNVVR